MVWKVTRVKGFYFFFYIRVTKENIMKVMNIFGEETKVYQDGDFVGAFNASVKKAREMWLVSCIENFKNDGDNGTCVLGAGIQIWYLAPKCRKPSKMMLISANSVSQCQGSTNWEKGREAVLSSLRADGIDCQYAWGNAD
jgi:hypothetical protein